MKLNILGEEELRKWVIKRTGDASLWRSHRGVLLDLANEILKQILEWGDEECPHQKARWRRNCWGCWEELKKEAAR